MKTFQTSIVINAQPERVWELLTDGAGYPDWNTTVDKVEGRIAQGEPGGPAQRSPSRAHDHRREPKPFSARERCFATSREEM